MIVATSCLFSFIRRLDIPIMNMLVLLVLLAGFAIQGGRATVTYQPTPLKKGDGQGCPSDENKVQVIENIHNFIEDRVETESTPEGRLLTELNTAVETLSQEVADLSSTAQTVSAIVDGLITLNAAASCRELFENRPDLPSGYYWIRSSNGTAVQLYCDMARQCGCNETTGGWTRIAFLNMTDPSQQCPQEWRENTSPRRTCRRTNGASCESVNYQNNGISYSRVCGRVIGYQYCSTDGFALRNNPTIDSNYVDGVSITHGSPRQHVWTFANGQSESASITIIGCPCITNPNPANPSVPLFVGDDYFCDTGHTGDPRPCGDISTNLVIEHPLWDDGGCGPTGACCVNNNPPWFCKTLPQPTTDDIEVRLCAEEAFTNEDIVIELIEIYVK